MLILALWACTSLPITDDQRAELEALKTKALDQAGPLDEERRKAFAAARGTIGARPDMGACPVRPKRPDANDVGLFSDDGRVFTLGSVPFEVVHQKDVGDVDGPRKDRVEAAVTNDIESMLFTNYRASSQDEIDEGLARAREIAEPGFIPEDGTLVIDSEIEPTIDGDTFTGGEILGRLYLYSYAEHRIVCAARVQATNSGAIGVHKYAADEGDGFQLSVLDLKRDVYRRGVDQGVTQLSVAGPALVEATFLP